MFRAASSNAEEARGVLAGRRNPKIVVTLRRACLFLTVSWKALAAGQTVTVRTRPNRSEMELSQFQIDRPKRSELQVHQRSFSNLDGAAQGNWYVIGTLRIFTLLVQNIQIYSHTHFHFHSIFIFSGIRRQYIIIQ